MLVSICNLNLTRPNPDLSAADAYQFSKICGCFPSQGLLIQCTHFVYPNIISIVWGVIWLLIAFIFFACGVLVGIAAFKNTAAEQKEHDIIPTGDKNGGSQLIFSASSLLLSCLVAAWSSL